MAVRVEINVEADALVVLDGCGLSNEGLVFGCIPGCLAFVCFRTWARGSAPGYIPLERPVSVVVAADARTCAHCLAILAPKTVGGLGVYETWMKVRMALSKRQSK